ncbi:glycoside hydrolase family 25 protein [Brevibacillus sp. SKDU10]|uniref:glycoside hydrolase family 25 protein n=1 Tax=Brevibacillus sp. SKDU10 TaxID=1247872 RepID=UPI0009EDF3BA|nr:glycoside hydrolase family 25 protein [Brevibacillus sp. SKDU10]
MKVGYYHFAHPDISAQVQADHFFQTVKGLPCDMPLVLDIETDKGLTPAQITAFCLAFLNHVKGHTGKTPMIYTGAYFAKRNLGKALAGFPLWVAHYNTNQPMLNPTWSRWAVFQYSDCGKVSGINGNVDMNCMEKDFWDAIMKEETTVKLEIANEIISHLQGQWAFYNQMGMKDKAVRIRELADELRVASGQAPQNIQLLKGSAKHLSIK